MRHRKLRYPKSGEQRDREGFLFLPKQCNIESDEYRAEERWLERAKWKETFFAGYDYSGWEGSKWLSNGKNSYLGISPSTIFWTLVVAVVVIAAVLVIIYG